MSQRLYIGVTEDDSYECVLESAAGAEEKLRKDWMSICGGFFLGPLKIRIGDKNLFLEIEPVIAGILAELGQEYPDSIWSFYYGERSIEHPTKTELEDWIKF
jgi:hypothetical protein